ncbi:strictosidine synthase [Leptospira ryugenii]|uniref:Strictosidine synthase n=1 Tax=Leptospira ryugenii TaxID=1917863 RepID=A0A2P2DZQ0_9LEPT|nr:SMP-30/gluconolactonase/LRE family protein [Leptospira ryugenii]GBF50114.1 strictosidine synthase [Leptospira ryugenii]
MPEPSKQFLFFLFICLSSFQCKSIDSLPYEPMSKPEPVGVYEVNELLTKSDLLAQGKVAGLESLDIDDKGNVYGGDREGNIIQISPKGDIKVLANTGGRPLGVQFDSKKNLIIADAFKGLLSLSPNGDLRTLVDAYQGVPFQFTDDLDIAKDGKIYFSDASVYKQTEYLYDLLESRPYGKVYVYDPKTQSTNLIADNLYFANGIALSQKEDFLLVNETYRYRITRIWLSGSKKGQRDIFIDNLPGFPDNITRNEKGEFWLALFTVRNDRMDRMHPSPWKKNATAKLPKFLWPKPQAYGYCLLLDANGKPKLSLQDPKGNHLKEITSVIEVKGKLYLGSLYSDRIGIYDLQGK